MFSCFVGIFYVEVYYVKFIEENCWKNVFVFYYVFKIDFNL